MEINGVSQINGVTQLNGARQITVGEANIWGEVT